MYEERRKIIRDALERYLRRVDPREAAYQKLAKQHSLLPILPDWTGFVGLREDGVIFWVSNDDDVIRRARLMWRRAWLIALIGMIVGGLTIAGLTGDWIGSLIAAALSYPLIYCCTRKASSMSILNHEQLKAWRASRRRPSED